ncbi:amidohydrolase [Phytohabitans rumicis]|uniref:Amidohydrolase n=1 Tax=Phytohabitans rumicis TaxID=1076125 RepID=A0A6V8LIW0_9ACTN|nr:amidohydrolase [Phytohabitans rumicis]GFJ94851.1 amidohydrolase [Phytohabitans rumicis]
MLDLRLQNANVLTMDPARPTATAVGVWAGRIIGLDDQIAGLPARRTIDLGGATLLPGLVDSHTHLIAEGFAQGAVDVSAGTTVEAVLDTIAAAAAAADAGAWIDVVGYDQRRIGRHLTRAELDRAGGGRRVIVDHISGHAAVVSSAVLAGFPATHPDLDGVARGDAGEPTGVLYERATGLARGLRLPLSTGELVDALGHAAQTCVSQGLTGAVEAGVGALGIGFSPAEVAAYQTARAAGRLPIRVQLMVSADALHPLAAHRDDPIRQGIDLGLRSGFGDDHLGLGAVKIFTDGGVMVRTAALTAPFEGTDNVGVLAQPAEEIRAVVLDAHAAGWQVGIHAIGDRAIDLALDAIEAAQRAYPRPDPRHRIEHCGITRDDQLDRIAALGVIASIQPCFLVDNAEDYAAVLGPARMHWQYRGKSFVDRGIGIAGGSDRPLGAGSPLVGIQFMVERTSLRGTVTGPDEGLSVEQAIAAYTSGAAYAAHRERDFGTVSARKHADFTVLSDDPRRVDPSRIAKLDVVATIVGGSIVYGDLA